MTDLHLFCLGFCRAAPPPDPTAAAPEHHRGVGCEGTRTTVGGAKRGQERIGVYKRKREKSERAGAYGRRGERSQGQSRALPISAV